MRNIVLSLSLIIFASSSLAEQKDSNGGSGVAAEFIEAAHDLVTRLRTTPIAGVDLEKFTAAVAETKVVTKKNLVLRGDAVDAINYPSKKLIEVSVTRWNLLTETPWVKLQLTFHEYLGILGLDDSNYKISRQILNSNLCSRAVEVVKAVEKAIRRSCDEVTFKELSFLTELTIGNLSEFKISDFKDLPNLGRLEIVSDLPKLLLKREFTVLLPKLYSLDIKADQVLIKPGTFEDSKLNYLAVYNAKLKPGSLKGLKAEIIMIREISSEANAESLEAELATEDYLCALTEGDLPKRFHLGCQRN